MYHFIACLYAGNFDGFVEERMDMVEEFMEDLNGIKFFTSESYQVAIMHLMQQHSFTQAREVLQRAKSRFEGEREYLLLDVLIEYWTQRRTEAERKAKAYYAQTSEPIFLLIRAALQAIKKNYTKAEDLFEEFFEQYEDPDYLPHERLMHFALYLNSDLFEDSKENEEEFMERSIMIKKLVIEALKDDDAGIGELKAFASEFFRMENIQVATNILNSIIDRDPYDKEAWGFLSFVLFQDERYAEAAEALKTRIAIKDIDPMIYYNCGYCHQQIHDYAQAIYYYEMQAKEFPMMLSDNKDLYAELNNHKAFCLMKIGSFTEALEVCESVLKIDPNNFQATVQIGQCYNFMNENDKALGYLLQAFKMYDPHDEKNYENMFEIIGDIFAEASELQEKDKQQESLGNAIISYQKSLNHLLRTSNMEKSSFEQVQKKSAIKYLKIGRLFLVVQDTNQALLNFQLALMANPDQPSLHTFISIAYYLVGLDEEAFIHFSRIPTQELEEFKPLIPELAKIEREFNKKRSL